MTENQMYMVKKMKYRSLTLGEGINDMDAVWAEFIRILKKLPKDIRFPDIYIKDFFITGGDGKEFEVTAEWYLDQGNLLEVTVDPTGLPTYAGLLDKKIFNGNDLDEVPDFLDKIFGKDE